MADTTRRRPRGRVRILFLALCVVLGVLWGAREFGWLGTLGLEREPREPSETETPVASGGSGAAGSDIAAPGGGAGAAGASAEAPVQRATESVPGGSGVPATADREDARDDRIAAAERDVRNGLESRVREAARAGEFARAFEDLDRLTVLDEGDGERIGAELRGIVSARIERAMAHVAAGELLVARELLSSLVDRDVAARVAGAFESRDGSAAQAPAWTGPAPRAAGIEAPAPLEVGAELRVLARVASVAGGDAEPEGSLVRTARLASSSGARPDHVTLRLRSGDGVVYPSVPRVAVEPAAASISSALDQCRVAIHAGERVLAVLWWIRARDLGADAASLDPLHDALR